MSFTQPKLNNLPFPHPLFVYKMREKPQKSCCLTESATPRLCRWGPKCRNKIWDLLKITSHP